MTPPVAVDGVDALFAGGTGVACGAAADGNADAVADGNVPDGEGAAAGDAATEGNGSADGEGCDGGGPPAEGDGDGDCCAAGVAASAMRGAAATNTTAAQAMMPAAREIGEALGDFVGAVSGMTFGGYEQRTTRLMLRVIHRPAHRIRELIRALAAGSSHRSHGAALGACAVTVMVTVSCGSAATTASPSARAVASPAQQPIATAPPPPSFPLPTGNAPVPTASAQSPITYTVPPGYAITIATDQEVELDSTQGSERLVFVVDPSIEDVGHAAGRVSVGGETGYILSRGATQDGLYKEVVIVRHRGAQYELSCTGFRGYDSARLTSGCDTFTRSIAFTS